MDRGNSQSAGLKSESGHLQDIALCAEAIRNGSKSFHTASKLLPRDVRAAAFALYAFCREADDAIDQSAQPQMALRGIRRRLSDAFAGRPAPTATDRAFAWVVRAYGIPKSVPDALIEGFEWDTLGRRYETLEDLKAYAARVASTVGIMMALVMGVRSREALARACDLGMAMQLTNIARDIGEDARSGRCYLPLSWLREKGLEPDALAHLPSADERLRELTGRLLTAARPLYTAGYQGTSYLPLACRPAIRAAARIYAAIGEEIAQAGYDSVSRRAVVPRRRKLLLAAGAFLPAGSPMTPGLSAEPACVALIEAAMGSRPLLSSDPGALRPGTAPWALDLFLRLEQRNLQTGAG